LYSVKFAALTIAFPHFLQSPIAIFNLDKKKEKETLKKLKKKKEERKEKKENLAPKRRIRP